MFEVDLDPVFGVADPLLAQAILESDQGGRGLFADLLFAGGEDWGEDWGRDWAGEKAAAVKDTGKDAGEGARHG